jgi:PncC family amidohydrolase
MQQLLDRSHRIASLLKARGETVAVAESSTGGLVSAALLAVPGASAYFLGGAVIYTRVARRALLDIDNAAMMDLRSATEPYALLLAATVRDKHGATWGLGESGAAGPAGNSYGDAAGHACFAVAGPPAEGEGQAFTIETASPDRAENMRRFAAALFDLFIAKLDRSPAISPGA